MTRGVEDGRVAGVVIDVEGAVTVAVVLRATLRERQLVAVERDLLSQAAVVPADAGVEDRHLDARRAGRVLPGAVGRDAGNLAERVAARERVLRAVSDDVWVERVVVERGRLRGIRREPEALVLLVEWVRAGCRALLVVGLAAVEVGVVRRVDPNAFVGIGPGEGWPTRPRARSRAARERGLRAWCCELILPRHSPRTATSPI